MAKPDILMLSAQVDFWANNESEDMASRALIYSFLMFPACLNLLVLFSTSSKEIHLMPIFSCQIRWL